jgi:hypothetical protein
MKKFIIITGIFLSTIAIITLIAVFWRDWSVENVHLSQERQKIAILHEIAEIKADMALIPWRVNLYKGSLISVVVGFLGSIFAAVTVFLVGYARQKNIVEEIIGDHIIRVHYKAVCKPEFAGHITEIIQSEIEKNTLPERALALHKNLLSGYVDVARQIKTPAIETVKQTALPIIEKQEHVPTFRELLSSGQISSGKAMILGYEDGSPRRGGFLDIYSAAVAGESGSGKTATLLYLIGSALISGPVHFIGIDPHYPHPKSLGFKTKPLWEAGLMQMATYKDDMLKALQGIEQTIDNRLKQQDQETTPVVLVIDELAFLAKSSISKAIAHTMERISTEGRKCAVYMLASSQTWLVARTGSSSVVRDTLTSAFVHRIKPKQANLLLQDKEEAGKVKKYCRHPGEVLLCPVGDESVVCKIPYATTEDMKDVVNMVSRNGTETFEMELETTRKREETPFLVDVGKLRETLRNAIETKQETLSGFSKKINMNKGQISKFLKGDKPSENLQMALSEYFKEML